MILLWNEESQKHYLEISSKEFKMDFLAELCDGIRKKILKFYLEIFNISSLNLSEIKQVSLFSFKKKNLKKKIGDKNSLHNQQAILREK